MIRLLSVVRLHVTENRPRGQDRTPFDSVAVVTVAGPTPARRLAVDGGPEKPADRR